MRVRGAARGRGWGMGERAPACRQSARPTDRATPARPAPHTRRLPPRIASFPPNPPPPLPSAKAAAGAILLRVAGEGAKHASPLTHKEYRASVAAGKVVRDATRKAAREAALPPDGRGGRFGPPAGAPPVPARLPSRGAAKQAGPSQEEEGDSQVDQWVLCDECDEWRLLPAAWPLSSLPDIWTCSMMH